MNVWNDLKWDFKLQLYKQRERRQHRAQCGNKDRAQIVGQSGWRSIQLTSSQQAQTLFVVKGSVFGVMWHQVGETLWGNTRASGEGAAKRELAVIRRLHWFKSIDLLLKKWEKMGRRRESSDFLTFNHSRCTTTSHCLAQVKISASWLHSNTHSNTRIYCI